MGIVLSAAVLLALVCLTFGTEVEIVMDSVSRTRENIALQMIDEAQKYSANPCIAQKTCKDCIRAGCAWCASQDMDYTAGGKKRCNYRHIILDECGKDTVSYVQPDTATADAYGVGGYREFDIYLAPKDSYELDPVLRKADDFPYITFTYENVNVTYGPENIQAIFSILCPRDQSSITRTKNFCKDLKKGDLVDLSTWIKFLFCPENRDEWNQTVQIYELHRVPKLLFTVRVHMICECDCEKPWKEERNSPKCSGRGTYHCGVCSCYDNWYGKQCECEGKPTGDTDDDDETCIAPHDTKICSGRGRCRCGICECFNKTSVTGRFCECDACPRSEDGDICGGKDHGKCVCGECECTDEWTGPACDCKKDRIEACRSPYNGQICHGFGECKCGKCQCFERDGILRSGPYCADCHTCPLQYAKYQSCGRCLQFVP